MATAITGSHRHQTNRQNHPKILNRQDSAIDHAVRLIHAVCGLAGSATWIDDIRADLRADKVQTAIRHRDTAVVFDWLMAALSYQGIGDQVAYDYMERHGRGAWRDIGQKLGRGVSCPKLKSYWHFHGCRYEKASRTCAEPEHIGGCPLPSHDLRNGHLNQAAYSLFLFIRDLADGDLIGWIDAQLEAANGPAWPAPVKPNGGGPHRADAADLRRLGQGPRHGPVQPAARRSQEAGPLDRGRRQPQRVVKSSLPPSENLHRRRHPVPAP
jgi:hypothetical protein